MEKLRTMADALQLVRQEHPDTTMSKLCFLEIRGVINTLVGADGQKWVKAGEVTRALTTEQRRERLVEESAPAPFTR